MIISIEGNIGSGKSTILSLLKDKYSDNSNVIFVDEPVSEWNSIKDNGKSILELFYSDKEKFSFTFQILAYITRLRKLLEVLKDSKDKVIVCERSIYTDKNVFAKMLHQQKYISDMEWKTYNYWFDTFKEQTNLDYIIYVKTNPEICLNRIKKRNRTGESDIPLEYLLHCDELHSEWLEKTEKNVIFFDGNQDLDDENRYIESLNFENLII